MSRVLARPGTPTNRQWPRAIAIPFPRGRHRPPPGFELLVWVEGREGYVDSSSTVSRPAQSVAERVDGALDVRLDEVPHHVQVLPAETRPERPIAGEQAPAPQFGPLDVAQQEHLRAQNGQEDVSSPAGHQGSQEAPSQHEARSELGDDAGHDGLNDTVQLLSHLGAQGSQVGGQERCGQAFSSEPEESAGATKEAVGVSEVVAVVEPEYASDRPSRCARPRVVPAGRTTVNTPSDVVQQVLLLDCPAWRGPRV
jgi:hypothetical protein